MFIVFVQHKISSISFSKCETRRKNKEKTAHFINKNIAITWYNNQKMNRIDGPAHVFYNENEQIYEERWYKCGNLHRIDGPAVVAYYKNGNARHKSWHEYGKMYRKYGPLAIKYLENGNVSSEWWHEDSDLSGIGKYESITHFKNCNMRVDTWTDFHGKNPSVVIYEKDRSEMSCEHGREYQAKGPIRIRYSEI